MKQSDPTPLHGLVVCVIVKLKKIGILSSDEIDDIIEHFEEMCEGEVLEGHEQEYDALLLALKMLSDNPNHKLDVRRKLGPARGELLELSSNNPIDMIEELISSIRATRPQKDEDKNGD